MLRFWFIAKMFVNGEIIGQGGDYKFYKIREYVSIVIM